MFRRKHVMAAVAVVIIIPVAIIGWWLASPLFLDKTVDEELPFSTNASLPSNTTRAEVGQTMAGGSKADLMVDAGMPSITPPADGSVSQAGPPSMPTSAPTPADKSASPTTSQMTNPPTETTEEITRDPASDSAMAPKADDSPTPEQPTDTPSMDKSSDESLAQAASEAAVLPTADTPPEPVVLKSGSFRDADGAHQGSGQAIIYRAPDGSLLLRLEDLKVTNGPELHVILTPHPDPTNQTGVKTPGYVDLGKLKGNMGNQNYVIPSDVDVAAQGSVVIYCKPFHVIFSVASLNGVS